MGCCSPKSNCCVIEALIDLYRRCWTIIAGPITHKDEVFMTAESIKEDTLKTFNTAFWNTFANVLSLIIGTVMVPRTPMSIMR